MKTKNPRETNTSSICRDGPNGAIDLNFGMRGDIADVITHAKFCDNRFRGFGVLIPRILPFSIGIAGRPYITLSTTVLHCDIGRTVLFRYLTAASAIAATAADKSSMSPAARRELLREYILT